MHLEPLTETRCRQNRVVARVIVDGRGVEIPADGFGLLCDLTDAARRRSLEVHVLEHMGDPDDVVRLVEISRAHERHDGDDGRGKI